MSKVESDCIWKKHVSETESMRIGITTKTVFIPIQNRCVVWEIKKGFLKSLSIIAVRIVFIVLFVFNVYVSLPSTPIYIIV